MASTPSATTPSSPLSPRTSSTDVPPAAPIGQVGAQPTQMEATLDIAAYRQTAEGKEIAAWVTSEFDKMKTARKQKESAWYVNLAMYLGQQHAVRMPTGTPGGFDQKLMREPAPSAERKTINRVRAFVRWEQSKFISQTPTITAVPGSGEDEDVRSSYAAEQVWESESSGKQLRKHWSRSSWWGILTGNGFVKTEWDMWCKAPDGQLGDIRFSSISPFHLFVPDMREPDIQNQPYMVFAFTKTVDWVKSIWAEELKGVDISGSSNGSASLIDEAFLNLQKSSNMDCVIVKEMWIKPGAHRLFPTGGLVMMVEDTIINVYQTFPYAHGNFPVAHFKHLDTGAFYADTPLYDLNSLQKEYNQLRTRISETAKKMSMLSIIAMRGSVVPSKISNKDAQVIEWKQGFAPPVFAQPASIPAYALQQQDRVLQDFADLSGIQDVTSGQAPSGVTAGTALNYLQEAANRFHTPQFQEIEFVHEEIARQTLALFAQFVDLPRAIKVVGADMAYDTLTLRGSDIAGGMDVRVEANSSAPVSQAAQRAYAMDLFSIQAIDQGTLLKMVQVGGFQRVMDLIQVAEKKAQREDLQMKKLQPMMIEAAVNAQMVQLQQQLAANPQLEEDPEVQDMLANGPTPPLLIKVDDFDDHATHIAIHNAFCMGQEYAMLDESVQQQIRMHVMVHQQYLQQQQMQQFMASMPGDGTEGAPPEEGTAPGPEGSQAPAGPPSMAPTPGGPNG